MVGGVGHPVGHGLESGRRGRSRGCIQGLDGLAALNLHLLPCGEGSWGSDAGRSSSGHPDTAFHSRQRRGHGASQAGDSSPGLGVRGRVSLWDAWRPPGPETVSVNVRWQGRGWTSCLSARCKVPSCREGSGLDPASLPRCLCAGGSGHCPKPSSWPLGSSGKQAPPGRGGGATDVSLMIGPGLRAPFS